MQTDIALERRTVDNQADGRERIIIDTKFTSILKSGQYRNQTLSSGYIYQMYAYLRSQERAHDPRSLNSAGVLLYPATDCDVDESAMIQGHEIRFATADLAADTQTIRQTTPTHPIHQPAVYDHASQGNHISLRTNFDRTFPRPSGFRPTPE